MVQVKVSFPVWALICEGFVLKCVKSYRGHACSVCLSGFLSSQRMNPLHPSPLCVWIQSQALCVWRKRGGGGRYSTDLHIFHSIEWPSQIIKCPFISKGHWRGIGSKPNTERPVRGALSLTLWPATLWVAVAFKCSTWDVVIKKINSVDIVRSSCLKTAL